MNILYKLTCVFFYGFLRLAYKMEIKGVENIPEGPALMASNHSSYFDPPIIASSAPLEMHFLAKAALFKKGLFGWYIRKVNSHPVQGGADDVHALRTVLSLLKEGKKVLIFPEGGRSFDGDWIPFKQGVAMLSLHAHVPIVPIVIEGAHEVWKKGMKMPKLTGKIKITYLPPIYPEAFAGLPKKEAQKALTEQLFTVMSAVKPPYSSKV